MTDVPYSGVPETRADLSDADFCRVEQWSRLVAVQWVRDGRDAVPNVARAIFEAGRLYEREQRRELRDGR
jgi:hypothetical protein